MAYSRNTIIRSGWRVFWLIYRSVQYYCITRVRQSVQKYAVRNVNSIFDESVLKRQCMRNPIAMCMWRIKLVYMFKCDNFRLLRIRVKCEVAQIDSWNIKFVLIGKNHHGVVECTVSRQNTSENDDLSVRVAKMVPKTPSYWCNAKNFYVLKKKIIHFMRLSRWLRHNRQILRRDLSHVYILLLHCWIDILEKLVLVYIEIMIRSDGSFVR